MCEPVDDLPFAECAAIFGGPDVFADYLAIAGIAFGDPAYDWCGGVMRQEAAEWLAER